MKEFFRGVFPPAISAICFFLIVDSEGDRLFITACVVRKVSKESSKFFRVY